MSQTSNTLDPATRWKSIVVPNLAVADPFGLFARLNQARGKVRGTSEKPAARNELKDWIYELGDAQAVSERGMRKAASQLSNVEGFAKADLATDILRDPDQHLWLLEAHLNQPEHSN